MQAGELTERFAFEKRLDLGEPGNAYGVVEAGWVEQFRCATKKFPLRRGEAVIASRLTGVQPYILTIRASTQSRLVQTDWRARDTRTGLTYNIQTVEPSPDRATLDLLVQQGGADG